MLSSILEKERAKNMEHEIDMEAGIKNSTCGLGFRVKTYNRVNPKP